MKKDFLKSLRSFFIKDVVIIFIISRVLLLFFGQIASDIFPNYTYSQSELNQTYIETNYRSNELRMLSLDSNFNLREFIDISKFNRFDTGFYTRLADNGYDKFKYDEPHPAANWAFFPLYPLMITIAKAVTFNIFSTFTTGFVLSNIFFLIGLTFIYKYVHKNFSQDVATKTVLLLSIFPATFYFMTAYTESLFFMLFALTLYYSDNKNWLLASIFAGLTTITRNIGIFAPLMVGLFILKEHKYNLKETVTKLKNYVILLSAVPLSAFMFFMYNLTGSPIAAFKEPLNWGRESYFPVTPLLNYLKNPTFVSHWEFGLMGFIFAALGLALALYSFKKLDLPVAVFGFLAIIVPLTANLVSITRYSMSATPIFITMAIISVKKKEIDYFFNFFFLFWLAIYFFGFVNSYFYAV